MRYGLLALSIAMLTVGGVAAQSALAISYSASAKPASDVHAGAERGGSYGSVPYSAARAQGLRLAVR
mgnify:CR=1 FL=1